MSLLTENFHIELYDPRRKTRFPVEGNFQKVAKDIHAHYISREYDANKTQRGVDVSGSIITGESDTDRKPIGMFDTATYNELLANGDPDMLWLAQILQVAPRKEVSSKTLS